MFIQKIDFYKITTNKYNFSEEYGIKDFEEYLSSYFGLVEDIDLNFQNRKEGTFLEENTKVYITGICLEKNATHVKVDNILYKIRKFKNTRFKTIVTCRRV